MLTVLNIRRYSLIAEPKVEFSLTGIYVATNAGDIPFLLSGVGGLVTQHIDGATVLSRMGSHFNNARYNRSNQERNAHFLVRNVNCLFFQI